MVNKVIVEKPKTCIHIQSFGVSHKEFIEELCKQIRKIKGCNYEVNQQIILSKKAVKIYWEDSTTTTIYCERYEDSLRGNRGDRNADYIDLVLMDDLLPMGDFPFGFKQCLSMVSINALAGIYYQGRVDISIHTYGLNSQKRFNSND